MTRSLSHHHFETEVYIDDQPYVRPSAARASNVEPMRRPDYKARKHAKPQPWLRYAAREALEMAVIVAFCVAVCALAVGVA